MRLTSLLRSASRIPITLVSTGEQCHALVQRILNSGVRNVGVDCEGSQLGRFGSLSLVQIATGREVALVDVQVGGSAVVEPLLPLLGSRELVKVFHDCREDASVLLHQHGASLAAVFDTQVGHLAWLERRNLELYQASVAEVLRTFRLDSYRAHRWDQLERWPVVPHRWRQRPLDPQAVRYAVEGVAHLLTLQRALCRELGDPQGELVLRRSLSYVEYAGLNRAELPTADASVIRPGAPLRAMLASRQPEAAYLKLNHGAITGAVLDAQDLRDFIDLRPGDVAQCRVKFVSDCGQFVHLQREGHGRLVFDQRQLEMRILPDADEVRRATPRRPSTMYKIGKRRGGGLEQETSNHREQKPEVVHKLGKRGAVKVRSNTWRPPKRPEGGEQTRM